jgi:maleylpyruvate isomerase
VVAVVLDGRMADDRTAEREFASAVLSEAAARLLRTVDGFHGDDWSTPSLLPGWTRTHVVAHLALNAEALARMLHGVVADEDEDVPRTMYDSFDQRAHDIAELGEAQPSEIRERLMGATTTLADAIVAMPEDLWQNRVERTPGGRTMRASAVPGMRLRELEIHHVDLDAGYTRADWTLEFAEHMLDAMTKRVRPDDPFEIRPVDSGRTWVLGDGEAAPALPVVTGPSADLAWWLTGRPPDNTLSCSRGELPPIEGW